MASFWSGLFQGMEPLGGNIAQRVTLNREQARKDEIRRRKEAMEHRRMMLTLAIQQNNPALLQKTLGEMDMPEGTGRALESGMVPQVVQGMPSSLVDPEGGMGTVIAAGDYFRDKGLSPEGVREAQPHFIGRLTAAGRESQQRGMSLEALQRKNRMDELELQKEEASWIERSVEVTDENGLPANDANGKPIRRPLTAEELRRLDVDKNWKFDSTNLAWINSLTQDVVPLSSELYKFIRDRRLAAKGKAPMSEATISDIANTTSLMHQARVLRSMLYGTRIGLDGKERSGTKFTLENAKILRDFLGGGVWGEIKRKFTTDKNKGIKFLRTTTPPVVIDFMPKLLDLRDKISKTRTGAAQTTIEAELYKQIAGDLEFTPEAAMSKLTGVIFSFTHEISMLGGTLPKGWDPKLDVLDYFNTVSKNADFGAYSGDFDYLKGKAETAGLNLVEEWQELRRGHEGKLLDEEDNKRLRYLTLELIARGLIGRGGGVQGSSTYKITKDITPEEPEAFKLGDTARWLRNRHTPSPPQR